MMTTIQVMEDGKVRDANAQELAEIEASASAKPTQEQYVGLAQERLDNFARTRNYDSILSACSYSGSAVPRFAIEGDYAVVARDATWARCYELLGQVLAGAIQQPTLDEFDALLPVLEWPA